MYFFRREEIQEIQSDRYGNLTAKDTRKCRNQEDDAKEKTLIIYKTHKKYKKYDPIDMAI